MSVSPAARSKARHYIMQALYQWHMSGNSLNLIEAEFHTDNNMAKVDTEYFHEMLHAIPANLEATDEDFKPFLKGMTLQQLDPITLALLRLATYEMRHRIDVPYKVVINEAVNLAKKFGAADSHKFINGVLDRVAEKLRGVEVSAVRANK